MRHADAGYEDAIDCAREKNLNLPAIIPGGGDAHHSDEAIVPENPPRIKAPFQAI